MKNYNSGFQIKNYNNRNYGQRRNIPFGIKLKVLFSNPLTFMGLMFLGMGIPFTMTFAPLSVLFEPSFNEQDPIAKGVIIDANGTNSSINDVQVYAYTYEYKTSGGNEYVATGYSTGNDWAVGNEVKVRYKVKEPSVAQADGLRNSTFGGGFTFFVWIFPIVGFIMSFVSIKKSVKNIRVLKVGELAEGKFLHQEATNMKVNNQTVYALVFEFKAKDGKNYKAIAKTHRTYRLLDEELEKLVYDPANPSNAVLLDALPRGLKKYFLHYYGK